MKFGNTVGFGGHIRQMTRTAQTEGDLLVRRTARGATALHGAPWRPTPYQVFGGLFWLVLCLASWRVPMCCDFGQHAAVVERLRTNLLHPAHPTADLPGEGSPFYSPYTVAQGAFARLTGLAGWEVVRLSVPLNLLVLLTGIGRFVRVLAPRRPWAPVCALLAMVLLWGTERAWSSGYLGLMSMTGTSAIRRRSPSDSPSGPGRSRARSREGSAARSGTSARAGCGACPGTRGSASSTG